MASFESDIASTSTTSGTTSTATRTGAVTAQAATDAGKPAATRTRASTPELSTLDAGKPLSGRTGNVSPQPSTLDAGKPLAGRGGAVHPGAQMVNAVLVPGDFRPVDVLVVNKDGDPLPEVNQLLALAPFPASTSINDDARGRLPCLSASYTDFRGIADRVGSGSVDYAWFEGVENVIGPDDDEAVIVLNPSEIKGMMAGGGPAMGGFLG